MAAIRRSGALPAMTAAFSAPIEMPASRRLEHTSLIGTERAATLQHQNDGAVIADYRGGQGVRRIMADHHYCMNQPWLTTIDWPVSAADGKVAR